MGDTIYRDSTYTEGYLKGIGAIRDGSGKLVLKDFEFPSWFEIVGERYAVGLEGNRQMNVLDLLEGKYVTLPVKGDYLSEIPPAFSGTSNESSFPRFYISDFSSNPANPGYEVTIYEIDNAQPKKVETIHFGSDFSVQDNTLFGVSKDKKRIERYSIDDFEKLDDLQLSSEIQEKLSAKPKLALGILDKTLLLTESMPNGAVQYEHFDLKTQERLSIPQGRWLPARGELRGTPTIFYHSNGQVADHLMSFDRDTDQVLWEKEFGHEITCFGRIDEHLIFGDGRYGATIQLVNSRTGKVERQFRPFGFAAWLIPLFVIFAAFWGVLWIRESSAIIPPWLNLIPLAGIPLLLLTAYLVKWDYIPGVPNLHIFNYCHGIFVGLTFAGFSWLILGRTRVGLRYLPVIGILSLLVVICRLIFSDFRFAAEAFTSTVFPGIVVLLPAALLRWSGFRWKRYLDQGSTGPEVEKQSGIPIRDLFIAAACAAVLMAVLKPVLSRLGFPNLDMHFLVGTTLALIGASVLLICTQSTSKSALRFAYGLIACLLVVASRLKPCILSLRDREFFVMRMSFQLVLLRVIVTALLAQFAVLLTYRSRGWRLERTV